MPRHSSQRPRSRRHYDRAYDEDLEEAYDSDLEFDDSTCVGRCCAWVEKICCLFVSAIVFAFVVTLALAIAWRCLTRFATPRPASKAATRSTRCSALAAGGCRRSTTAPGHFMRNGHCGSGYNEVMTSHGRWESNLPWAIEAFVYATDGGPDGHFEQNRERARGITAPSWRTLASRRAGAALLRCGPGGPDGGNTHRGDGAGGNCFEKDEGD